MLSPANFTHKVLVSKGHSDLLKGTMGMGKTRATIHIFWLLLSIFLLVKPWAYLSCQSGKESLFLREHQTHLSLHYSWKSSVRAVRSGEVWQATGNLFSAWGRVVSKWVFGNSRQLFIISNAYSIQNTILGSFKVIWPVLLSWLHFVIWNTTGEMSHTYTEIKISHVFSIQRSNQVTSPEKNKMI